METYEKVYDDYLYDCYVANKRLSPEDWAYYGKEEHHVVVPTRDGGLLTPCNSQYLTVYQHWIAGVLQSEVLQKCCFAAIPLGALRGEVETLRVKWQSCHNAEIGVKGGLVTGPRALIQKTGIFDPDYLQSDRKKEVSKKAGKKGGDKGGPAAQRMGVGIHGRSAQQWSEDSRKGGSVGGRVGGRTTGRMRFRCTVTGHVSTPGGLAVWQRARGIDPCNRERLP
jgi:hypothetical protein